jgi:Methyltransferase domain
MHVYPRQLRMMVDRGWIQPQHSILVLAGGSFDRQVMLDGGLKNVTISNLDYHAGQRDYEPFAWKMIDAEKIDAEDNSYDWVTIHAGLHHLAVPAMGVCEMFRVARRGILCVEARDSLLMKLAVRLGLTADFELEPAFLTGGKVGGYRNGPIPNYVYRWTEREFEKVVNAYSPTHQHEFFYGYGFQVPVQRLAMAKNPAYRLMGSALSQATKIAEFAMPKQGNQFAFGALKNVELHPWLTTDLQFKSSYLDRKYEKSKYPSAPKLG